MSNTFNNLALNLSDSVQSTETPKKPLISVDKVEVSYQLNNEPFVVFKDIDLTIEPGSFVSIVGPSGCGKTTLLKVMSGLQDATGGKVRLKDKVISGPPENMVYVFQQYSKSIFPWRTVWQNVVYGIEDNKKLSKKEIEQKAKKYLELVGLDGKDKLYPSQMSGGMQQRLAIARALACEPEVLLMDEPFSAVDALTKMKLQQMLLDIWSKMNVTIIFVTHDVEEAVYLSSRIISLTKSPATIDKDLHIDLAYPRNQLKTKEDEKFIHYRHELLKSIFQAEGME
jgi:NitT/TauT family transport system ATP-binding protein